MKWSKKYIYPPVKTNNSSGVRTYSVNGVNLPSVTTILKMTESDEKKESLSIQDTEEKTRREEVLSSIDENVQTK